MTRNYQHGYKRGLAADINQLSPGFDQDGLPNLSQDVGGTHPGLLYLDFLWTGLSKWLPFSYFLHLCCHWQPILPSKISCQWQHNLRKSENGSHFESSAYESMYNIEQIDFEKPIKLWYKWRGNNFRFPCSWVWPRVARRSPSPTSPTSPISPISPSRSVSVCSFSVHSSFMWNAMFAL